MRRCQRNASWWSQLCCTIRRAIGTSGIVDRNDSSVFLLLNPALNLCFNRGTWECQIALESHRDNERLSEFSSDRYLVISGWVHTATYQFGYVRFMLWWGWELSMQSQRTEVSNRSFDFRTCVVEGTFGTLLENYRAKNTFGRISHQFSIFSYFGDATLISIAWPSSW